MEDNEPYEEKRTKKQKKQKSKKPTKPEEDDNNPSPRESIDEIELQDSSQRRSLQSSPHSESTKKKSSSKHKKEHDSPSSPKKSKVRSLSTEEATSKLISKLMIVLDTNEPKHWSLREVVLFFKHMSSINLVLAVLALVVAAIVYSVDSGTKPIIVVEIFLFVIVMIVNLCLELYEKRATAFSAINKLRAHLQNFQAEPLLGLRIDAASVNTAISTVYALRDKHWQVIPLNMIVEGDVIGLLHQEKSLLRVKCLEPDYEEVTLQAGEAFSIENLSSPATDGKKKKKTKDVHLLTDRWRFECLETPAVHQVLKSINSSSKPLSPMENHIRITRKVCYWVLWVSLVISLIVNFIRYFVQEIDHEKTQWVTLLLVRQAYLSVPLLHLSFPFILLVCMAYGNARIMALFHFIQEIRKGSFNKYTDMDLEKQKQKKFVVPNDLFRQYFYCLLSAKNGALSLYSRLVYTLGSVTVICSVDNGPISEPVKNIGQVFLLKEGGYTILNMSRNPSATENEHTIIFEDLNWQEHIRALKPLGLNCLLNKTCGVIDKTDGTTTSPSALALECLKQKHDPTNVYCQCCCLLGKEIGFSEGALESYIRLKEIHSFSAIEESSPINPSYTLSLVIKESNSGTLQLLSKGSTELVLDNCTAYWDGEAVCPLTPEVKDVILQTCKEWLSTGDRSCIGFAYRPIDKRYQSHFLDRSVDLEDPAESPAMISSPMSIHLHKQSSLITIEDSYAIMKSPKDARPQKRIQKTKKDSMDETNESNKGDLLKELQHEQVFIGMIATRYLPVARTSEFIKDLRNSGIRFVFFSPEVESRIKAFADKLGLETDWNCCISLKETEDGMAKPVHSDNAEAHLPRGVRAIREHLEQDVDNVPLLVPMFSEANTETTTEMVKIFQDFGEVVCCIGSGLKYNNTDVFAQADLAISVEPSFSLCLNKPPDVEHLIPYMTSHNFIAQSSSSSLSCDLTSGPCSLIMHRSAHLIDLFQLIEEARRLMTNMKQSMLLYLYYVIWLHGLLLCSYIVLPGHYQVFNGYQLFWMVWIIIPVLCLSLLLSPEENDAIDLIPDKNLRNNSRIIRTGALLVVRATFSIILDLVLYIWCFDLLWPPATVKGILGADEDTAALNSSSFHDVQLYAQNILLFAIVYHMSFYVFSFTYHRQSLFATNPRRLLQFGSISAFVVSVALQVVFCAISLSGTPYLLDRLRWDFFVVLFLWPIPQTAIDEVIKRYERDWFYHYQKELRLEFDTRLGKYSPK